MKSRTSVIFLRIPPAELDDHVFLSACDFFACGLLRQGARCAEGAHMSGSDAVVFLILQMHITEPLRHIHF